MTDLARLARPFPRELVQKDPGGNAYVAHENVTQWLLGIVGPFDFTLVEIIRGNVTGQPPNPQGNSRRAKEGTPDLQGVIVGGVWRITLEVDGRTVMIEEAGDVEDPHNWRHDGARLKQAASDAIKRCAMRVGLGLHLWAGERYVLDARLQQAPPAADPPANGHQPPPVAFQTGRDLLRDLHLSANAAAHILRAEAPSDFATITFQEVLRLQGDPLRKAAAYLRAQQSDRGQAGSGLTSEGLATRTDEAPGQPGRHRGRPSDLTSEAGERPRVSARVPADRHDPASDLTSPEPNPATTASAGSGEPTSPPTLGDDKAGRGRRGATSAGKGRIAEAPAAPDDDAPLPGWEQ